MKIFHRTGPNTVGVNYMWMPTFIGMNGALIKEIEDHVAPLLIGQGLTEEALAIANDAALDFLTKKFPDISGLFEYLDGLKYVETDGRSGQQEESQRGQAPHSGL